MGISVRDHQRLQIEGQRWKHVGAKDSAIRDLCGESTWIHARRVDELIDNPEVIAYYPMLTARLRRLRAARASIRSNKRTA